MTVGVLHRHGHVVHRHPDTGSHRHLTLPQRSQPVEHDHEHRRGDAHDHEDGHTHGPYVDRSIIRSRAGVRAVSLSLAVLTVTAAAQTAIYVFVLSVALLADVIHNFGDALTAIPLGLAFFFRSVRGERWAGFAVVVTILVSACVALVQTILRLIHPHTLTHLWWLAAAGVIGFVGNEIAARIRLRAGRRLSSPALTADGTTLAPTASSASAFLRAPRSSRSVLRLPTRSSASRSRSSSCESPGSRGASCPRPSPAR